MSRRQRSSRRLLTSMTAAAASGCLLLLPSISLATRPAHNADVNVVVRALPGESEQAQRSIEAVGGKVTRSLSIIDGFSARVPAASIVSLGKASGVRAVTSDTRMHPLSTSQDLGYDSNTDVGSLSAITQVVGAQAMWNAGFTGKGVDVAVIDTGVTRVPGLDAAGRVIDGPDLSFDSQNAFLDHQDSFGHGTNMASIIAGSDVAPNTSAKQCNTCIGSSAYTDTTKFVGVAPESRIVNVKVGATDGATDVSQVIAAIDWVVQHRKDSGLNIRVINLSFGTDTTQPADVDPLSYAAEVAWRKGIVVVVSAGNDGLSTASLAAPAYNPTILAVGAIDLNGTLSTDDDYVPIFASHGDGQRSVDVVAPGTHVLGLRVPGSFIDSTVTTGKVGSRFQRGSGTSQAAAVVSGLAALYVQKFPDATPDQVKLYFNTNAIPKPIFEGFNLPKLTSFYSGNGIATVRPASTLVSAPSAPAAPAYGTGLGTLQGARGTSSVVSNGVTLSGEKDIFGQAWNGSRWTRLAWKATAWTGGTWNGSRWTGDGWLGSRWTSTIWTGSDWSGSRWTGAGWTAMVWDGSRWTGDGWNGSRWTDMTWDGSRWSSSSWS